MRSLPVVLALRAALRYAALGVALLSFSVPLSARPAASQSIWSVDSAAPGPGNGTPSSPYPSIQAAIAAPATVSGDTLDVAAGTYGPIDFLGKALRIVGGSGRLIDATGAGTPCVLVRSGEGRGTRIEGLELRAGRGLLVNGVGRGGGALVDGATLALEACTIVDCVGGPNVANSRGGGIAAINGATLSVTGTTIRGCRASLGGGVSVEASSAVFMSCTVAQNNPTGGASEGGGLYVTGGRLVAIGSEFTSNRAFRGAGARVIGTAARFEDCLFESNTDTLGCFRGGAIEGEGVIARCTFRLNRAQFGGALYGPFEVRDSEFSENGFGSTEASFGGAFHGGGLAGARAQDSTFRDNFVYGKGGATHSVALERCTLTGNYAIEYAPSFEDAFGGAMFNGSAVECVFTANRTVDGGHPFLIDSGGAAYGALLERCVLYGNEATRGGGAANSILDRCTVLDNVARSTGGGVFGGFAVTSSIVRGNQPGQIAGPSSAQPSVTYSDVAGGAMGQGNFDADPHFFGPLTRDLALFTGSPCIDTGDPNTMDPDGSRADVGAFPFDRMYRGTPAAYCTAKVTSAGCTPRIGAVAVPSLTGPAFEVHAEQVIGGTTGFLTWSLAPDSRPYLGGTLCVASPLARIRPVTATGIGGCDGVLTYTFTGLDLVAAGLVPGERMHLQWLFRDAAQLDGTRYGLTDALEATVVP